MNESITTKAAGNWFRRLLGKGRDSRITAAREHDLPIGSEERYRMLTEHMKDVVWVMDADSLRYRYVSPSFFGVLGYTPEDAMSFERADQTLLPEDRSRFSAVVRKHCAELRGGKMVCSEEFSTLEFQQQRKDGSRLWTECVLHFQCFPESDRIEVQGVVRDISARKLADLYHAMDIEVLRTFESSEPMDVLFDQA